MSRATFSLDTESYDKLFELIKNLQGESPKIINEVFWNYGGPMINEAIMNLLPVSNRKWKGKKPSAKMAAPFTQENQELSVTIKTKNAYHYLYFPDDGTSTRKHVGEKYFMFSGAEVSQDEIINICIQKLLEKLG